jgi:cytochrome c5
MFRTPIRTLTIISIIVFCCLLAWIDRSIADSANIRSAQFTDIFLQDRDNVVAGEKIWKKRCKFCHGKHTHPDKGPKLAKLIKKRPRHYKPEFIYKRVTFGFRSMPGWRMKYTNNERMALVAYILSENFLSP